MRTRLVLAWITVLLGTAILSPAWGQASTLDEYRKTVSSAERALASALEMERRKPGSSDDALKSLSKTLPDATTVTTPRGESIKTDLSWIQDDIDRVLRLSGKRRTDELGKLHERVQSLSAAAESMPESNEASVGEARAALAEILKRKEYGESPIEGWIRRVLDSPLLNRAERSLGSILNRLFTPEVVRVLGWAVIVVLVLAFAAALVYLVLHLTGRRSSQGSSPGRNRQPIAKKRGRPSVEALLEQAESEASDGRYRDAFRTMYLASILLLDRARLVTYTESGTNWEYMRAVKRQGDQDIARLFGDMTADFDRFIYGLGSVHDAEYTGQVERFRQLEGVLT